MFSKKFLKFFAISSFSLISFNQIHFNYSYASSFDECNKLNDAQEFRDCMSKANSNKDIVVQDKLSEAINALDSGDPAGALGKVNNYLEENKNSAEGYLFRALINEWDFANLNDALNDYSKAIALNDKYAEAYALRGSHLYWELSNKPAADKDLKKALAISPNSSLINFLMAEYLFDFAITLYEKDKKEQALDFGNQAISYYEKVLSSDNSKPDYLVRRIFPLGITYVALAEIGYIKFDGYFLLKELKDRKKAKEYLNESIISYTKAIELAPSQEITDKLEIDMNYDNWDLGELYLNRGNAQSWINNNWKKACNDFKTSKKLGNKDAQKTYRESRC